MSTPQSPLGHTCQVLVGLSLGTLMQQVPGHFRTEPGLNAALDLPPRELTFQGGVCQPQDTCLLTCCAGTGPLRDRQAPDRNCPPQWQVSPNPRFVTEICTKEGAAL